MNNFSQIYCGENDDSESPGFTTILNNSLNDPRLSNDALLVWIRCRQRANMPNWQFYTTELAKHCRLGINKLRKCLNELIEHRYALRLIAIQNEGKGKFDSESTIVKYYFFPQPVSKERIAFLTEEFKKFYRSHGFRGHENEHLEKKDREEKKERKKLTKKERAPMAHDASLRSAEKVSSSSILKEADEIPRSPPKPPPKKTSPKKLTTSEPVQEVADSHPEALNYLHTFGRPLVGLTRTEYKKIVDKLGEPTTSEWIQELADWKASNALSGDKAHLKHSDAYRIVRWASKAKRDAEKRSLNTGQIKALHDDSSKTNKIAAQERVKSLPKTQGKVEFLAKHVEIGSSPHLTCISYTEKGFMEQFENALRKWRLL